MSHFVCRLIPPRPSFVMDMTDAERAIMGAHAVYWKGPIEEGRVVVFGVVVERECGWGLAVVEADAEDDVRALVDDDPAVKSGTCTFEIGMMPNPTVRPAQVGV